MGDKIAWPRKKLEGDVEERRKLKTREAKTRDGKRKEKHKYRMLQAPEYESNDLLLSWTEIKI